VREKEDREEIDLVPERRNQRERGRGTKRRGTILSIHTAGNRKRKRKEK
jgi:hypothetical protein